MNVFHRDVHFPKRSSRSPHASKPPPMNEVMSDDDCKTKMEEVVKELELCKQIAGRNRLLPSTTLRNTESQYNYHLNGILHFCKLVGDVRSMILLSKTVKAGTHPSVDPRAIANCAGHKIGTKGSVLCDMDDNIIHDACAASIKCVEDWKAPACYE